MSSAVEHAGDLTPEEALKTLTTTPAAVLVDVRTTAEWSNIGVADLTSIGAAPVLLEWLSYPAMTQNPAFVTELKAELERRGADTDTPLLFLCRSGARSTAAARAMSALGYGRSFNVAGGFEGSPGQGLPGWRQSGLPWTVG